MLEIEGLTKAFGGLIAVTDVALTVPAGKIISLIGPNGAGKTTLFAIVSGFLKPDRGQVRFRGDEITGLTPHGYTTRYRHRLGYPNGPIGTVSDTRYHCTDRTA